MIDPEIAMQLYDPASGKITEWFNSDNAKVGEAPGRTPLDSLEAILGRELIDSEVDSYTDTDYGKIIDLKDGRVLRTYKLSKTMKERRYDPGKQVTWQHAKQQGLDYNIELLKKKIARTNNRMLKEKWQNEIERLESMYDPGWNAGRKNTLWNRVNKYERSSSDDVRSHLRRTYDNENKGSWLDFVKAHKDMRTAKGLLDLKAISKLWHEEKAKGYDPGKHTQWGQVQKHRRRARYTSTADDYSPVRKHWRRLFDLLDTKTRPPAKWFYAMLQGIKKGSDVRDPASIVSSIWQRLSPAKRASIKAKEAKGGTFKYDLPLPEDMQTRGTGTLRIVKPFKLAEVQVNLSVKDYLHALKSGLFSRMKRGDGTTALVKRCKSDKGNCNIFLDQ